MRCAQRVVPVGAEYDDGLCGLDEHSGGQGRAERPLRACSGIPAAAPARPLTGHGAHDGEGHVHRHSQRSLEMSASHSAAADGGKERHGGRGNE